MHPSSQTPRNSPIEAVLLTNADLDHVQGLFLLREGRKLRLYAPESIFDVLNRELRLTKLLKPFCRVDWQEPPGGEFGALFTQKDEPSGLQYRALTLSSKPPPFVENSTPSGPQSVAYEIKDERTHGRLVIAPDVALITPELFLTMESADAVLFDGTFWSTCELQGITGTTRTSDDMGHLTIKNGSMDVLRKMKAHHKIYIHINNTNPILNPDSSEHAEVTRAGMVVGHDGLEFEV